jgi:hypothetical protein
MPLCITGMHRSGTSMVARLLNVCGLGLGPEAELLPPAFDNPAGFWENAGVVRLNDALLRAWGGSWDRPPPGAGTTPGGLRSRALGLVGRLAGRGPWGWKGPRCCLTLPFWRGLVSGLRVLVCVRHPAAAARSLAARGRVPYGEALALWLEYNRRVLAAVPPAERVVTHYESYFGPPRAELRRVLRLLDLAPPRGAVRRACAGIAPALAHHRSEGELPEGLRACYHTLCAEGDRPPPAPSGSSDNLSPACRAAYFTAPKAAKQLFLCSTSTARKPAARSRSVWNSSGRGVSSRST